MKDPGTNSLESARIGVAVVAAAMIAAIPGQTLTKHYHRTAHHHLTSSYVAQVTAPEPQTTYLGAMRYYGGPKSPMWREVG